MNTVQTDMSSKIVIHQKPGEQAARKVKLPAYQGLRPAARQRHKVLPPWATALLTGVGLFAIIAFMADVYSFSRRPQAQALARIDPARMILAITSATNRYQDPQGRFSIALPPGWTAQFGDDRSEFDAKLEGPDRLRLFIIAAHAPGETMQNLKRVFSDIEQETARQTHIEDLQFQGRPAISRYCRMDVDALRSIDFLVGDTAFHLMAMIPREHFESQRVIVDALMETIRPGPAAASGAVPQ